MWVRGLKPRYIWLLLKQNTVAPHVGAWIETFLQEHCPGECYVAPHVGAWIETQVRLRYDTRECVAPHVGAWIETSSRGCVPHLVGVAPHVGAWIETNSWHTKGNAAESHPMWVRGLKHF